MSEHIPIPDEQWRRIPEDVRELLMAAFAQLTARIAELKGIVEVRTMWGVAVSLDRSISDPLCRVTTFVYDGTGRTIATRESGTVTYTTYDANGNIVPSRNEASPPDSPASGDKSPDKPDEPFISGQ